MTGGEAPDMSQCVLEGSGDAPGASGVVSLDGSAEATRRLTPTPSRVRNLGCREGAALG